MPLEPVEFALIRPIFWRFHQTLLDRILPEIQPFLGVAFAAAQLAVEEVGLPDGFFSKVWPAACAIISPELRP